MGEGLARYLIIAIGNPYYIMIMDSSVDGLDDSGEIE